MTPRLRTSLLGSLVLLLSGLAYLRAQAQDVSCPPESDRAASSDYERSIDLALAEYRAQRFVEARTWFERAHAFCPSARTLRGLGLTAFELAHYPSAAHFLRRALADPTRPLVAPLRTETLELLARTERLLSVVTLAVAPASATLSLDSAQPIAVPASLELAVGEHVLELAALGHITRRLRLDAHGGERLTLQVALEPFAPELALSGPRVSRATPSFSVSPSSVSPSSASERRVLPLPRWLWTTVGVVTIAAALGLGFGLRTRPVQTAAAIAEQPIATRGGP